MKRFQKLSKGNQAFLKATALVLVGIVVGAWLGYSYGVGQPGSTAKCHDVMRTTPTTVTLQWANGWSESMDEGVYKQLASDPYANLMDLEIPGMNTFPKVTHNPGISIGNQQVCTVDLGTGSWGVVQFTTG
jgi:hypothetical protein